MSECHNERFVSCRLLTVILPSLHRCPFIQYPYHMPSYGYRLRCTLWLVRGSLLLSDNCTAPAWSSYLCSCHYIELEDSWQLLPGDQESRGSILYTGRQITNKAPFKHHIGPKIRKNDNVDCCPEAMYKQGNHQPLWLWKLMYSVAADSPYITFILLIE